MYYGSPVISTADVIRECGYEEEVWGDPNEECEPTIEELRDEWREARDRAEKHGLPASQFRAAVEAEVNRGFAPIPLDKVPPTSWVACARRVADRQVR